MSRSNWWPILIIALALAAGLAIVTQSALQLRAPIVLGFLLIGPGMAFVRLLGIQQTSIELTLAIALSLTLDLLLAEGMILARVWSAGIAVAVLILLAVAGAGLQMLAPQRGGRSAVEE